ncbi:MAG: phospho-N-acetylmuramoyl-pentapeptide-transferase [Candidatus Eremiobacteraeota bacterium]|nr:phospho-N-acetylmuramoyl-pentapeptide-transferase [Candidatus Eremiobacteraeota bacterium]
MQPPFVVLAGVAVGAFILPSLIAIQRRGQLGQHVYEDAPKSHTLKAGTPTMGGIAFVCAALVGCAIGGFGPFALALAALAVAAGAIGLADDMLILRARRALGLRARWKFALIAIAAIAYSAWVLGTGLASPQQTWFGTTVTLQLWLWWALAVLAIVGAANAVNLTDGLDGLAAGTSIPVLIGLLLTARYQHVTGPTIVGDAVLGALLAFLWFNRHPARIFMGDTGSLALGALLAGLAIQSGALLLLPLFGMVFVLETLSVIAQVVSFKSTGKRIFKMSPIHHHFELSGWRETAVTSTFVVFASLAAAATWVSWWAVSMRAARPL